MTETDDKAGDGLPDFILGGAMKCATSSLHHLLRQHEEIHLPEGETHFFSMDDSVQHAGFFFPPRNPSLLSPDYERDFEKNLEWYRSLLDPARPDQTVGDYSTVYLAAPEAPRRIQELVPNVKLVFMLRNPVDRTYSHYWHRVKTGRAMHTFEHELQHGPSTLLLRSFYRGQLERYFKYFSRSQVKVVLFEHFVADTQTVVDNVCSFLGLSTSVNLAKVEAHKNKSPVPRWPGIQRLFNYLATGVEGRGDTRLPYPKKPQSPYVVQGLVHHLRELNLTTGRDTPPMNDATRSCLQQIFRRRNRGLSDMIDANLSNHWPCMREIPTKSGANSVA